MAVTIGNVTSNVSVVDSNNMLTEEMLERIVSQVMARLREERDDGQEQEIRDRMSDADYFLRS